MYGDIDWEKVGAITVSIISAFMAAYAAFWKEKRTNAQADAEIAKARLKDEEDRRKADEEREIRVAAVYKKAWTEAIDRQGKDQARWVAERDRLDERIRGIEAREQECQKSLDHLEEECSRARADVKSLKAENAHLAGRVEYLVRLCRKNGLDPGTDEFTPVSEEE